MSRREDSRVSKDDNEKTVSKGEERVFVRTPLGKKKDRLTCPEVPGHHVHIINDSNVPEMLERGYKFLEKDYVIGDATMGTATQSGSVMTLDVGGGVTGYIMILTDEWRNDDNLVRRQAVVNQSLAELDKLDQASFYGKVSSK